MTNCTVFVSGKFNVLHPGHVRLLRFAKSVGTRLVVAVEADSISGEVAHVPELLRLAGIQSNRFVDESFIATEPVEDIITRLRPDVVVKGREHEFRINPELVALEQYGGRLLFSSGETIFSSMDLIQKEFNQPLNSSINVPLDFMRRHRITPDRLKSIISKFSELSVCVVGDLIVDEYVMCEPLGMSQEDATIVVTPVESKRFIGGAGIVAAHAAGLGASVNFYTVTGEDEARDFALGKLRNIGVEAEGFIDSSRPTSLKQRIRSKGKVLLRVSHLRQNAIPTVMQRKFVQSMKPTLKKADLLVFSDFNYGCLPQSLVDILTDFAKSRNVLIAADSQSSSQLGDISRFKGMDLITPTEREARISTRNREDGLVVLAENIRKQALAQNVLLKMGEEGFLVHANSDDGQDWITDRVEALNSSPKDVAGAGDSLLIASAMTLACGGSIWEAACLGALAAAVQVGRIGNTPLSREELIGVLN